MKDQKIFSAIDINSDGTWFGLNEYGVVVGLTNLYPRTKKIKPNDSRGKLCLNALKQPSAKETCEFLEDNFDFKKYQKVNIISADKDNAFVSMCGEDLNTIPLPKGFHVLTNYNFKYKPETKEDMDLMMDSKHRRDRAIELIENYSIEDVYSAVDILKTICRDHKKSDYPRGSKFRKYFTICCHGDEIYPWKTSSSSIIALSKEGTEESKYFYSGGNPCNTRYIDYSHLFTNHPSYTIKK